MEIEKKAERFSCSLDIDLIKQVSSEASKRGQSKSYLIAKYLKIAISMDKNITVAERYRWNMGLIKDSIETLLSSIGIIYKGDMTKAIVMLYTLPVDFYETKYQYDMVKLSVMELLESIRTVDVSLFRRIIEILKIQNDLKNSENSELNMPVRVLLNNTVTESLNGNSVTEFKSEVKK